MNFVHPVRMKVRQGLTLLLWLKQPTSSVWRLMLHFVEWEGGVGGGGGEEYVCTSVYSKQLKKKKKRSFCLLRPRVSVDLPVQLSVWGQWSPAPATAGWWTLGWRSLPAPQLHCAAIQEGKDLQCTINLHPNALVIVLHFTAEKIFWKLFAVFFLI